jgi:hypothetical protein
MERKGPERIDVGVLRRKDGRGQEELKRRVWIPDVPGCE